MVVGGGTGLLKPEGPGGRVREGRIDVLRSARFSFAGGEEGIRDLWVVLHGYRQLARFFLERFLPLATPDRRIVAPEGLSRFYLDEVGGAHGPEHRVGATWMTREDREAEIRDYVRYLDGLHVRLRQDAPGTPPARVVLGFSQGVHTAARWVAAGGVTPGILVLWGASLPEDLALPGLAEAMRGGEVVLVRGDADGMHPPGAPERDAALLQEAGVRVRSVRHPGGHRIDAGVLGELVEGPAHPGTPLPSE